MQKNLIAALIATSLLCACSEEKQRPVAVIPAPSTSAAGAPAGEVSRDHLMSAVFGKDYRPASKDALTKLPYFEDRKQQHFYRVFPVASTVLKTGETVLVAQAEYSEEKNGDDNYQGFEDIGLINVFVLKEVGGKWTVLKREENLVYRGDNDRRGGLFFTKLGKDREGLALVAGHTSEFGCENEFVLLYDLAEFPMRSLTGSIPSKRATKDCDHNQGLDSIVMSSKFHFAPGKKTSRYDDLVMVFTGEKITYEKTDVPADVATDSDDPVPSKPPKKARPFVTEKVSETARYAYTGKQYALISGQNPIAVVDKAQRAMEAAELKRIEANASQDVDTSSKDTSSH